MDDAMRDVIVPAALALDSAEVGGKAAVLGALTRAGFDVPPFLAITPEAFAADGLRPAARARLRDQLGTLGSGPFAVRSSGREEDGASHSHAGQFLSLLDIPADGVEQAALKVWRSGNTEGVRAYRASRGLDPSGGAPAVIVQRLIRARAAGVAFSADPVTGRRDHMVVSAIAGLGDRLVGGEADGDDYTIDRTTGATVAGSANGVLSAADLAALRALADKVEQAQGRPQDIEWAFEGDRLFLLQARPITTKLQAAAIADPTLTIFDNSNIVESYPGLVSPLTYSFAQYVYARVYRTFVALLGVSDEAIRAHGAVFENMLGRLDGRVYYNLINWYRALALLPGFANNRGYMETMMGVGEPLPQAVAQTIGGQPAIGLARWREHGRVAKAGFGLLREAFRLRRTVRDFYARLDAALRVSAAAVDAMPLTALAAEYRRMESELLERWDAPLINDFLCMIAFGASRKLIERWAGAAGLELHNDVMIGQGDIVSAEPARRIARMGALIAGHPDVVASLANGDAAALQRHSALADEAASYIAKFGDRCAEELKLESIPLSEDPRALLLAIAAAARMTGAKTRAAGNADGIGTLFASRPLKRALVRWALRLAKARVRDRENLRFERTRVFGQARRLFVAMGRQLQACGAIDEPRDVFYLTVAEVLGAIEGFGTSTDLKSLVALRKAEMTGAEQRPDPPERVTITGAAIACNLVPSESKAPSTSSDEMRSATGCSAGKVRARARVVRDPRHESVAQGEVLVARHTDPGWIALFTNASAIVVERGSLLSHSAIVARELGIPCVVGLKGAMDWLATGEEIEVDGAAGTVRKCRDGV
jgi:phosphohistidine swiveling domain-containing protein